MLIAPLQDKNNLVHCLTVVMMMMRLINRMSQYDRYKDLDGQLTQNHLAGRFEIKNLAGRRVEGEDRGRRSVFPPSGFSDGRFEYTCGLCILERLWRGLLLQSEAIQDLFSCLFCEYFRTHLRAMIIDLFSRPDVIFCA